MLFGKKKKTIECKSCGKQVEEKYSFCPYCGESLISEHEEAEEYGLLGKNDAEEISSARPLGFTDKLMDTVMSSMFRTLNKELKDIEKESIKQMQNASDSPNIVAMPNGVRIKIAQLPLMPNAKKQEKKAFPKPSVTDEQMERMVNLPRTQAKSQVERFANKVVYELSIPGVRDIKDVLVSKLESGYEIKAIGEKKVYSNSIPLNLPLKQVSLNKNKLLVEFLPEQ